jgi:hypothetical protein
MDRLARLSLLTVILGICAVVADAIDYDLVAVLLAVAAAFAAVEAGFTRNGNGEPGHGRRQP